MSNVKSLQLSHERPNLDLVAFKLNEICRSATLDLAFRIGEFIITQLFANDMDSWHAGARNPSYRALAARGDLVLSSSALCRAVSVYVLVARLGGRECWQELGASHFQEVLPLDLEAQRHLLQAAQAQRWTVARLRAEVARHDAQRVQRKAGKITRTIKTMGQRLTEHVETVANLAPHELCDVTVAEMQADIARMQEKLVELDEQLDRRLGRIIEGRRQSDIVELAPGSRASGNSHSR